jgi:ATP synthase assembly factor FMC1
LQDLLERYNPTHGMTVQERTKATARRVGLDIPKEGKPMGENET